MKFIEVSAARYDEMLGVLPPVAWLDKVARDHGGRFCRRWTGFLVGEAWRHNNEGQPMFAPFVTYAGRFYEGSEPIAVADWRKLDPRPLLPNRPHDIEDLWTKPHEDDCAWLAGKPCSCGQPKAL